MSRFVDEEFLYDLQDMGARFVANDLADAYPDTDIVTANASYALIKTEIGRRNAMVLTKAVMYPENYEKALDECLSEANDDINYLSKLVSEECDIYAIGLGCVQKNVESDEEKGQFIIGRKYAAAFGMMRLISRANGDDYGYTFENPIRLNNVSNEYVILKHLQSDLGPIVNVKRVGSMAGKIDKWKVDVLSLETNIKCCFSLYMDAYAIEMTEYLTKWIEKPLSEWEMPVGFTCGDVE